MATIEVSQEVVEVLGASPAIEISQAVFEFLEAHPAVEISQVTVEVITQEAALLVIESDCPTTQPEWNAPYSYDFDASGGVAPYTWSIVAGALPSGLSLDSATGIISGTALQVGSFSYTLQVADAGTQTATITCTFVIANPCASSADCAVPPEAERACSFTKEAERSCSFTKEGEC